MKDKKNYLHEFQGEQTLGSISLSSELLEDISGFWALELDDNKEPRLYLDEKSKYLLGIDNAKSPEAVFKIWEGFLDTPTKNIEKVAFETIKTGKRVENKYIFHNKVGNDIILKVEALLNKSYQNGMRIDGLYRNISSVFCANDAVNEQRTKLIENANQAYDFVYKVNLNDASFLILKIQEFMVRNHEKQFSNFNELKANMLSSFIHPADVELMTHELDYEVIREKIKTNAVYTVEYRAFINNNSYWNEMKVTKIDDDNVTLSFVANDQGIFLRMLQEKNE